MTMTVRLSDDPRWIASSAKRAAASFAGHFLFQTEVHHELPEQPITVQDEEFVNDAIMRNLSYVNPGNRIH